MVPNQITYKTTDRNHPYEIIRDYEGYKGEKILFFGINP